jgi:fructose-bisphosphate aldolase class 1
LVISRYEGQPEADFWGKLHLAIATVPELPEVKEVPVVRPEVVINRATINREMAECERMTLQSLISGYQVMAVTDLMV